MLPKRIAEREPLVIRVLYLVFSGPVGPRKEVLHQADAASRHVPEPVSV